MLIPLKIFIIFTGVLDYCEISSTKSLGVGPNRMYWDSVKCIAKLTYMYWDFKITNLIAAVAVHE